MPYNYLININSTYQFAIVAPWCYVGHKEVNIPDQVQLPYHLVRKTLPYTLMSIDDVSPNVLLDVTHHTNATSNRELLICQNYKNIRNNQLALYGCIFLLFDINIITSTNFEFTAYLMSIEYLNALHIPFFCTLESISMIYIPLYL